MARPYRHLTADERDHVAVLRSQGLSLRAIARALERDPATISRELTRNAPPIHTGDSLPHKAQARAEARWDRVGHRPRLRPAQAVSHETIAAWLYAEARHLIPSLVQHHRRRKRRGYSRKHTRTHIPSRVPMTQRPAVANARRRRGDWEADTLVTRPGRAALQLAVDRKSRYTRLNWLPRKTAAAMRGALNRSLSHLPARVRWTITYDNGSENVEHERVNAVLGTRSYFCTPSTSQERGTVEHTAGLVQRFFPKRTNVALLRRTEVKAVERWLNHRPRVVLNFHTPAEVFRSGVALEP